MRLVLDWAPVDAVAVEIDGLIPVPDDARGWILGCMRRGVPAGTRVGELTPVAAKSALGWPMEVYAAAVTDGEGRVVEARAGAFYKFLEYAGAAIARAPDAATLEAARGALLAAFESGRPEWRGPGYVAAIAELWD
jgi:hypothetical protein